MVGLLMLVVGTLAVLMGLLWIGQGLGYVRWPAESFMISAGRSAARSSPSAAR